MRPAQRQPPDFEPPSSRLTLAGTMGDAPDARTGATAEQSIASWVELLRTMLSLPRRESDGICEELRTHLEERSRDLMLAGLSETEAIRAAVGEIGDAAAVAGRYRWVGQRIQRRRIMHVSIFGLTGAALLMSIAALTGSMTGPLNAPAPCPPGSDGTPATPLGALSGLRLERRYPAQAEWSLAVESLRRAAVYEPGTPPADTNEKRITLSMEKTRLEDALQTAAASAGLSPRIHWRDLEARGISRDSEVSVSVQNATIAETLAVFSDMIGSPSDPLDCRVHEGTVDIGTRHDFDVQDRTLVCYDLSPLAGTDDILEVTGLVEQFVEPTGWRNNGGDLAESKLVASKLFIQAPARYHTQIRWIIDQLCDRHGEPEAATGTSTEVPVLSDLPLLSAFYRQQLGATTVPAPTPAPNAK